MANIDSLTKAGVDFTLLSAIDSTNNYIKSHADVLSDLHTVIADEQLCGRGRQGKSFYSPKDEGLYMSLLIKDENTVSDPLFTVKICLTICRAIDELTGTDNGNGVGIKWVNDIYFGKKKLCGILCERFTSNSGNTHVVAGIGVNLDTAHGRVPKEINGTITSLYDMTRTVYDRFELAACILRQFQAVFGCLSADDALTEYKQRSIVIGKEIDIIREEGNLRAAALDICEDGSLLVRTETGYTQKLCGGEISIRLKK